MQREYPLAPIVTVGTIIVRDGQVLLILRANPPNANRWSIPGGVVEVGETLAKAAAREAWEETRVQVNVGDIVAVRDLIVHDEQGRVQYHYVLIDLAAEYVGGEPQAGDDARAMRWVSASELDDLNIIPGLVPILRRALHSVAGYEPYRRYRSD